MPALIEVLQGALSLDNNDRAALAERLLASLEKPGTDENEALWLDEAERRLRDCQSDSSAIINSESVAEQAARRFR